MSKDIEVNDDKYDKMVSFWNVYEQGAGSFLARGADKINDAKDRYLEKLCEDLRGASILEVGGGDGFDAISIHRCFRPSSMVTIELADRRVKEARENVKRAGMEDKIRVEEMDAHDLKFADSSFDAIYCHSVLLFLNRPLALKEFVRVLKPNGFVICCESIAGNPLVELYRFAFPKLFPKSWKRQAEKLVKRMNIKEIEGIGQQYFHRMEHKEFYLFFSILVRVPYWILNRLVRGRTVYTVNSGNLAVKLDDALMQIFPFLRNWAWVSAIRYDKPIKKDGHFVNLVMEAPQDLDPEADVHRRCH